MPWVNGLNNNVECYKTVEDMKLDMFLRPGVTAITLGQNEFNDGNGRLYSIRERNRSDVIDGVRIIELANQLIAENVNIIGVVYANGNKPLPLNANLNDVVTDGSYYSNVIVGGIENKPSNYSFILYVKTISTVEGKCVRQTVEDSNGDIYLRTINYRSGSYIYGNWKKITA